MPLAGLNAQDRLGIANASLQNANAFAQTVLRLPAACPIYQQQLAHNTVDAQGPGRTATEWCGVADSDASRSTVLRSVSGHDGLFYRRNLSDYGGGVNNAPYRYNVYVTQQSQQLFFFTNEPEIGSKESFQPVCSICYEPPTHQIDSSLSFLTSLSPWEENIGALDVNCPNGSTYRRLSANALARSFLIARQTAELQNRNHTLLPPSCVNPRLGAHDSYWTGFYNAVKNGFGGTNAQNPAGIPVSALKGLHTHAYPAVTPTDPINEVGELAVRMRSGADWFRTNYNGGASLPLDYFLSEMGPHWQNGGISWSGGFSSMRLGLAFWNTYLCWLTRRSASVLNLQTGYTSYAMIHQPDFAPFTASNLASNSSRNQWYFNCDAWDVYINYNTPTFNPPTPSLDPDAKYRKAFPMLTPTNWGGRTWHLGPFGACYAVWSRVANDPVSAFGTGFYNDGGSASATAWTSVTVPAGWSTIYIPFIKNSGIFSGGLYSVIWRRGASTRNQGSIDLVNTTFPDTRSYTNYGLTEVIYSSMVLPLLVYSSQATTFEMQLQRSQAGPAIWVGRPIVLSGTSCTWTVFH